MSSKNTSPTNKSKEETFIDGKHLSDRLITPEDPIHLHKTLGILSLISFCYRYGYVWWTQGNLGFNGSLFDWLTIFLHMALSSSSLIFHVISKRMLSKPLIIWNEYRLHAIVFSLRCVSVYVFGMLVPMNKYIHLLQYATVMSHHIIVDEITRRYGVPDETTVRAQNKSRPLTKAVLRGYSFYQFLALGSHLLPNERTGDMGFNTLIAIQSSAFLMTLCRKRIIKGKTHGYIYTACLIVSAFHIFKSFPGFTFGASVLLAFSIRCYLHANKYVLWAGFSIFSSPYMQKVMLNNKAIPILSIVCTRLSTLVQTLESIPYIGACSGALLCIAVYYHLICKALENQKEWNRLHPKGHKTLPRGHESKLTTKQVLEEVAEKTTADNTPDTTPPLSPAQKVKVN